MWDGFNKRKFPRIALQCQIDIRSDEYKNPIHTITENIGVGGVCVILDKSIERFSHCKIKINLSDKKVFSCDAKVVWIVPTRDTKNTKKRFDVGIEFVDADPEQIQSVREYIESEVPKPIHS